MRKLLKLFPITVFFIIPGCNDIEIPVHDGPNIILIIADDLGYEDISIFNPQITHTPNIDALGREGIVFTQGYSTASVCTPSRAGLLTGRYQQRFGVYNYLSMGKENFNPYEHGVPVNEIFISDILKEKGYKTGLIGKWHLGLFNKFNPLSRGFDYFFGILGGTTDYSNGDDIVYGTVKSKSTAQYIEKTIFENSKMVTHSQLYVTDLFTEKAVQFIENNRKHPFFLTLSYTAPHSPYQITETYFSQTETTLDHNRRIYQGMIMAMDKGLGQIFGKISDIGIEQNTIIVFISDNGCDKSVDICNSDFTFSGGKGSLYEGGIRVPFILKFPEKLSMGVQYKKPVISIDIVPTILDLADIKYEDNMFDGISLLKSLSGDHTAERSFFWHEITDKLTAKYNDSKWAVRKGDWKLIHIPATSEDRLYNLVDDQQESTDLSGDYPDITSSLKSEFLEFSSINQEPIWQ